MSSTQLERKFIDHMPKAMSASLAQAWYDAAQSMVNQADIGELMNRLSGN
jgi:hypothetical protein